MDDEADGNMSVIRLETVEGTRGWAGRWAEAGSTIQCGLMSGDGE
jgi:hypothetical protein